MTGWDERMEVEMGFVECGGVGKRDVMRGMSLYLLLVVLRMLKRLREGGYPGGVRRRDGVEEKG